MVDISSLNWWMASGIASTLIVGAFIYMVSLSEKQKKARKNLERSLEKLKKAYDELDEQAKIIVKKDLELSRTQEELDKKLNSLYTLHKLSKAISSSVAIEKLFSQIDKSFIEELGFDKGIIILRDKDTKQYTVAVTIRYSEQERENIVKYINENDLLDKIGQAFIIDKNMLLDKQKKTLLELFATLSCCLVPIVSQEVKSGLIVVGSDLPYAQTTEGDLEILSILAGQIAGGVANTKLYEQLWLSHQELEQRVRQRTQELASANEKLQVIDKLKSEFVSAVSHELRTPLTSIKGYAAILMSGKLGAVPQAVKERLEKINKHSDSLTQLINDLLDISRIESGKAEMKREKLHLQTVIEEVADVIAPQIKEKNIQFIKIVSEEPLICLADRVQLERVFTNLLGNAIKFTPQAGKISITAKQLDNLLKINIEDTGIGMEESDLEHIFDEFYRVDNSINQAAKGTGLGLSLVKRIVEAHKGTLAVASKPGKGTIFSFTIPKA